tara:strand:+ start:7621 stop:9819 length:2199 start_codon:yes stop_codon:yes gene_type:complete
MNFTRKQLELMHPSELRKLKSDLKKKPLVKPLPPQQLNIPPLIMSMPTEEWGSAECIATCGGICTQHLCTDNPNFQNYPYNQTAEQMGCTPDMMWQPGPGFPSGCAVPGAFGYPTTCYSYLITTCTYTTAEGYGLSGIGCDPYTTGADACCMDGGYCTNYIGEGYDANSHPYGGNYDTNTGQIYPYCGYNSQYDTPNGEQPAYNYNPNANPISICWDLPGYPGQAGFPHEECIQWVNTHLNNCDYTPPLEYDEPPIIDDEGMEDGWDYLSEYSIEQFGDRYFLLPHTFRLSWSFVEGFSDGTSTYITMNIDGSFSTSGGSTGQYCIHGDGGSDACQVQQLTHPETNFYLLYDSGTWFAGELQQTMPLAGSTYDIDWSRYIAAGTMNLANDSEGVGSFSTDRLSVIPEPFARECNLPLCKDGRFFTTGGSEGNWMIDFYCTFNSLECGGNNDTFIYIWFDSGTSYVGELEHEMQINNDIPYYFFNGDTKRPGPIGSMFHNLFRHDGSHGRWMIGTLPGATESYHNHLAGPANLIENTNGWTNGFQQPEGCWKKALSECGCVYPLESNMNYGTCQPGSNCQYPDGPNDGVSTHCCSYLWDQQLMFYDCTCVCPDGTSSGSIGSTYTNTHDCNVDCNTFCTENDHMLVCDMDCVDDNYAECKWNLSTMDYLGDNFVAPNQSVDINQVNIWYNWISGPEYDNGHCTTQHNEYGIPGFCQLEMTLTDDDVLFFGHNV